MVGAIERFHIHGDENDKISPVIHRLLCRIYAIVGSLRSFPQDSCSPKQFYQVKRMIRGIYCRLNQPIERCIQWSLTPAFL